MSILRIVQYSQKCKAVTYDNRSQVKVIPWIVLYVEILFAKARGLSYVHVKVDKHGITIYTTYISVDLAHHEIVVAEVGKGPFYSLWLGIQDYFLQFRQQIFSSK